VTVSGSPVVAKPSCVTSSHLIFYNTQMRHLVPKPDSCRVLVLVLVFVIPTFSLPPSLLSNQEDFLWALPITASLYYALQDRARSHSDSGVCVCRRVGAFVAVEAPSRGSAESFYSHLTACAYSSSALPTRSSTAASFRASLT
jgi:hypothetical protein